ncbi:hypothetical protein LIP_0586 [Limnochorda pilosa]|uniref:Uncharacterized protein n=1 Tax=Limnochorda pilosa TaxID=1555112 RepID=A0A0K2SH49_LIMPI|nr:hypothetical protein LIP_0586 [Limnochorda pilosa]
MTEKLPTSGRITLQPSSGEWEYSGYVIVFTISYSLQAMDIPSAIAARAWMIRGLATERKRIPRGPRSSRAGAGPGFAAGPVHPERAGPAQVEPADVRRTE